MAQHGLVKKVFNNNYDITNLGAILFAKNLNDFSTVKRKSIRIVTYKGGFREDRIGEQEYSAGYAVIFDTLINYVNDKLPHHDEITSTFRKTIRMYPEVAVREFIANSLIHQDLSIRGAGTMIEIFDKRIEITNTGKPLIDTDRFIDHPPKSRNEDLASFMRQANYCEESGMGIDKALKSIAKYHLPAPNFCEYDDFTRVTLYAYQELRDMSIEDRVRTCYQHCVLGHLENIKMTNMTLRERFGVGEKKYTTISAIIKLALRNGLIKESDKPKEYIPIWA